MDESVRKAMEKWPNVPAVHDWLRLDTTGRWHLKDEPVIHRGLIDFIGRNYQSDERGRWYLQNGPQRAWVTLDYTPWILHVDSGGRLRTHTGDAVQPGDAAAVDDEGNLLIETQRGVGLVDPDTLPIVIEWLVDDRGRAASDEALAAIMAGAEAGSLGLLVAGRNLPVERVARADAGQRFGFVSRPEPDDADAAS